jgi:hypothetical protein
MIGRESGQLAKLILRNPAWGRAAPVGFFCCARRGNNRSTLSSGRLARQRLVVTRTLCYDVRMNRRPVHFEMIDDQMAAVLRAKTPAERIGMVSAANRTARILAAAGVRYLHPDWTETQVLDEVIKRVCRGTS